jgi:glycosyltransferase involved in cell wall biosynthesis
MQDVNENRPLVSIIIPNYNYARYLREAIDSALAQTYQPFEVIVVDDGSTDESRSVIQSYGPAIQPVFQKNEGLPSARNAGIAKAGGEFFVFLDADDALLPDAVAKLFEGFSENPDGGIVFGFSELVNASGERLAFHKNTRGSFTYEDFLFANFILVPEAMVSKRVIDEIGMFTPSFFQCEDYDFWIRSARKFAVRYVDKLVARVRSHDANLSKDRVIQLTWELRVQLAHYDGSFLTRRSLAKIYHRLAYECRVSNNPALFRRYVLKSIRYNPWYWKNWLYLGWSWLAGWRSGRKT